MLRDIYRKCIFILKKSNAHANSPVRRVIFNNLFERNFQRN